jgi:hypothetical protein
MSSPAVICRICARKDSTAYVTCQLCGLRCCQKWHLGHVCEPLKVRPVVITAPPSGLPTLDSAGMGLSKMEMDDNIELIAPRARYLAVIKDSSRTKNGLTSTRLLGAARYQQAYTCIADTGGVQSHPSVA